MAKKKIITGQPLNLNDGMRSNTLVLPMTYQVLDGFEGLHHSRDGERES